MKRHVFLASFIVLMIVHFSLFAQQQTEEKDGLLGSLRNLAQDAAVAYVKPINSGFGTDLNSGWYHRAPRATMFGFDLEFGVVAMGTVFNDEQKKFSTNGMFRLDSSQAADLTSFIQTDPSFNPYTLSQRQALQREAINQIRGVDFNLSLSGPTAAGSQSDTVKFHFKSKSVTLVDPNTGLSTTITVPQQDVALEGVTGLYGSDVSVFPWLAPQLTIGTFFGSQFTFRFLPTTDVKEFGRISYFGFGIQHNPMVWFNDPLPLDVSLGYFSQKLKLGSYLEATTSAFSLNASIRLGWGFLNLTPYVGYMIESSNFKYQYDYMFESVPQTISFEQKGENRSRLTLGASVKVLFINVNADINLGKYKAISGGIMIII